VVQIIRKEALTRRVGTGSFKKIQWPQRNRATTGRDDESRLMVDPDRMLRLNILSEELGMYTAEMDPKLGPKTLSAQEAARQRAVANALKVSQSGFTTSTADVGSDFGNSIVSSQVSSPQPTRQSTQVHSEDEDEMTEDQRRVVAHAKKCSGKVPRCTSAPGTRPPPKSAPAREPHGNGTPGSRSRAEAGPSQKVPEPSKAAAPPRAPAAKTKSKGDVGQESPGTKVPAHDPHPMATKLHASRAGSLRPGGGLGPTDTCVDLFNPSKT
jgi:hypothetical protein